MSKLFFFVGGTGQHILLSYLHLSRLAGFKPVENIFVFDGDNIPADGTVSKKIADFVANSTLDIKWINPNPENIKPEDRLINILTETNFQSESDIIYSFFEKDALDVKTFEGFYAKPLIGSVSVAKKFILYDELIKDNDNKLPENIKYLYNLLRNDVKKIGVIGSLFGGTGSGSSPVIAKKLRSWGAEKVFGLLHYKWYQLNRTNKALSEHEKIQEEELQSNTNACLKFYEDDLMNSFDLLTILGLPESISIARENDGGSKQQENKDALYIISAAIIHFMSGLNEAEFSNGLQKFTNEDDNKLGFSNLYIPDINHQNNWKLSDWKFHPAERENLSFYVKVVYNLAFYLEWLFFYLNSSKAKGGFLIDNLLPKEFDDKFFNLTEKDRQTFIKFIGLKRDEYYSTLDWLEGFDNEENKKYFDFRLGDAYPNYIVPPKIKDGEEKFFTEFEKIGRRFSNDPNIIDFLLAINKKLGDDSVINNLKDKSDFAADKFIEFAKNYFFKNL